MSGYDRLAPFIREYIFDSGWTALREVQERAIDAVLGSGDHVLITAGTASGKTEAAFFPILTRLVERPPEGFGALYIGPLKALINDQFERIDALLEEADIPVYAWHGDRPESEKKRARRDPRGVLQITPESLEGLLMRRPGEAARMLAGLQFIIIDELHAFMGTDRGLQLQCQLNRIDRLIGHVARRVGLSATIADCDAARAWLSAGTPLDTRVVESAAAGRKLDLALRHYRLEPKAGGARRAAEAARAWVGALVGGAKGDAPGASSPEWEAVSPDDGDAPASAGDAEASPGGRVVRVPAEGLPAGEAGIVRVHLTGDRPETGDLTVEVPGGRPGEVVEVEAEGVLPEGVDPEHVEVSVDVEPGEAPIPGEEALYADLYRMVRGRRCLVFTNSRAETEAVVSALRAEAARRGEPDVFHAHHGSLSAAIRADAEEAMKSAEGPAVAVATRTLELGIDLGKLDRVVQLGAADSCAGFVQRLGRSGRRGQPAVMRFLTRERPQGSQGKLAFDDLPWELVKTIAVLQLYLEERWVEPFEEKPLPYSLLFQQILSALMPGELTSRALAKAVHTLPAFAGIPAEDYMTLLRHMLDTDMLTRMETGTLLPGLRGERLAADYRFLSVFQDSGGIRVICNGREIGSIDSLPQAGGSFTMAGRTWQVAELDAGKGVVYVRPGEGAPEGGGWQSGGAGMHDRIVQKMRDVLLGGEEYPYLAPEAKTALADARRIAGGYDLRQPLTRLGGRLLVHPWLGTRKLETLEWLLRNRWSNDLLVQTVKPAGGRTALLVETMLPAKRFTKVLRDRLEALDPAALVAVAPAAPLDRNDAFLPESLRRKAYVYNHLDVEGLKRSLPAGE